MVDPAPKPPTPTTATKPVSTAAPNASEPSLVDRFWSAWNGESAAIDAAATPPANAITSTTDFRRTNATQNGPSPLKKQAKDPRFQPEYSPVSVIFLTGRYQGEVLDLGLAVNETSNEQSADWSDQDGTSIRVGCTFTRLSPRTFSLSLTYFSLSLDISHLGENCYTMQEMGDGELAPPFLMFSQGDLRASPVVCTDISTKYSEPLPGKVKGFRKAEVEVKFKMLGGVSSEHALGKPLASTPLADARAKRTLTEQQKKGTLAKIRQVLAPCLKSEADSRALQELIEANKLNDVEAILKLSSDAFIQSAVAGMIPKAVLKDPRIQSKLSSDLAAEMATSQDGIGAVGTESPRRFAQAILTGTYGGLTTALAAEAERAHADYKKIREAILEQKLGDKDSIFKPEQRAAAERLSRVGSCGMSLRQLGSPKVSEDKGDDQKTLAEINKLLAAANQGGLTDENKKKIEEMFGVSTDSQIRALLNGAPYSSGEEFRNHASRQNGAGMTGYAIWQNAATFIRRRDEPKTEEPK